MTLKVRVCGAETLTLADPAKKTFIFPQSRGDYATMSDSEKFHEIPESTFSSYFVLGPASDPCIVKDYQILSSSSGAVWVEAADNRVELRGSKGSYKLMLNKAVATNTVSVWLRAITRGLVTVDQQFEFVVCPNSGGVTVVPSPAQPAQRVWNVTNGLTETLASNALFK
jgi:hypothetical protein